MANEQNLKPFQPGQSGNPGGMSKELRAQIAANAEKATRIRAAWLDSLVAKLDAGEAFDPSMDLQKLIKDSEDRGLGAPTQTFAGDPEAPLFPTKVTLAGPDGGDT